MPNLPKRCHRNYLRVRGEYKPDSMLPETEAELPPRARRIPYDCAPAALFAGTTSACAENTLGQKLFHGKLRNYLRVRGEYLEMASHAVMIQELPPRARRIPWGSTDVNARPGTTSACAENTPLLRLPAPPSWNYLRVRGEYKARYYAWPSYWELPPRARRIRRHNLHQSVYSGTTSACAENTETSHAWGS